MTLESIWRKHLINGFGQTDAVELLALCNYHVCTASMTEEHDSVVIVLGRILTSIATDSLHTYVSGRIPLFTYSLLGLLSFLA